MISNWFSIRTTQSNAHGRVPQPLWRACHTDCVDLNFAPDAFLRVDESPDAEFYEQPRLVNHIDDYAIAAVGEAYRQFLPAGGDYLDLMSSWVSHFPKGFPVRRVVGHGMNEFELLRNPLLTEHFVQDLNLDAKLPLDDSSLDGVTICVSAQYLTQPVAVFKEVARVLKPGCPLIVIFSNRCFPTKAVAIWRALDDAGHARLLTAYAREATGFESAQTFDFSPRKTFHGVPDDASLRAKIAKGEVYTDPLFVVVARKRGLSAAG
jgi:SAM-dependent methyltransferase